MPAVIRLCTRICKMVLFFIRYSKRELNGRYTPFLQDFSNSGSRTKMSKDRIIVTTSYFTNFFYHLASSFLPLADDHFSLSVFLLCENSRRFSFSTSICPAAQPTNVTKTFLNSFYRRPGCDFSSEPALISADCFSPQAGNDDESSRGAGRTHPLSTCVFNR